ncbi:hypothetical protein MBANPS3_012193 [Mucor bainieri]
MAAINNTNGQQNEPQQALSRFFPQPDEDSPQLQQLFDSIDVQIDAFYSNNMGCTIPRAQLNRLVAGNLRKHDVESLKASFVVPTSLRQSAGMPDEDHGESLNGWQTFLDLEGGHEGKTQFSGCAEASARWALQSDEEKKAFRDMEVTPKRMTEKRKMYLFLNISTEAVKSMQILLQGGITEELKRQVNIMGNIGRSLLQNADQIPNSTGVDDNSHPFSSSSDLSGPSTNTGEKVNPEKPSISWKKIVNNPQYKVKLVGFPVGCRFTDGSKTSELAFPVVKDKKKGKGRLEWKLLGKQKFLYDENLLQSEDIKVRIRQQQE